MTMQQHATGTLQFQMEMLKMTLGDFSDGDMLVRPVPAANHVAWQLGHVIASETEMIDMVKPGTMPALPAGFAEKFSKETTKVDDPAAFPKKAELISLFERQRKATIAFVQALSDKELDQPGPEPMRQFVPTVAALVLLTPAHLAMHMGQMQVVRRKLGKPILF